MKIKECLQELFEEEMDKVFAVSENYLMTIARRGYEKEHAQHRVRAEILRQIISRADRLGG